MVATQASVQPSLSLQRVPKYDTLATIIALLKCLRTLRELASIRSSLNYCLSDKIFGSRALAAPATLITLGAGFPFDSRRARSNPRAAAAAPK